MARRHADMEPGRGAGTGLTGSEDEDVDSAKSDLVQFRHPNIVKKNSRQFVGLN